jgi:transcriptional regulator with XRE-family HTH domain
MATYRQEIVKEIGQRIKALRGELKLSQDEMARLFGIVRTTYNRYERGEAYPGPQVLSMLADRFNVSVDWLVCGKGPMFYRQKAEPEKVPELEEVMDDVKEMLALMERIPLLRYKVLTFLQEFKLENRDLVETAAKDIPDEKGTGS